MPIIKPAATLRPMVALNLTPAFLEISASTGSEWVNSIKLARTDICATDRLDS